MRRSVSSIPTRFQLNPTTPKPGCSQLQLATKLFSPPPILRFTVGKFNQLPSADSPEVVVVGRSNVGVILFVFWSHELIEEIFVVECFILCCTGEFCSGVESAGTYEDVEWVYCSWEEVYRH